MKFKLLKASTSVKTVVPLFDGFYNTIFENYWNSQEEIGRVFTDKVNEKIGSILPSFSYTFEKIYSPAQYNYSTDEIYATATFDMNELMNYLSANKSAFDSFAQSNFSSYDGFISFVPNNYDEFVQELTSKGSSDLSSFVVGAVEFILYNEYGDNIKHDLNEDTYYDMDVPEDERWEVDGFTYDTEEDARLEFQNICESEPSEDHVLMLNDEEIEFYKGK